MSDQITSLWLIKSRQIYCLMCTAVQQEQQHFITCLEVEKLKGYQLPGEIAKMLKSYISIQTNACVFVIFSTLQ